jgi:hypothetical protein
MFARYHKKTTYQTQLDTVNAFWPRIDYSNVTFSHMKTFTFCFLDWNEVEIIGTA